MSATRVFVIAWAGAALGSALGAGPAQAQKRQRDVITREEIQNSSHYTQDLYQVIRSLRPHFLAPPRGIRTLGAAPPAPAVLYINGNRAGDLEHLRTMSALDVQEVRYLDPSRAENQFGISHSGGAVMVTLIKRTRPGTTDPPPLAIHPGVMRSW